jgi:hypothetical protein
MHLNMSTITIGLAFAASLFLFFKETNRLFPTLAALASGVELLLALGVMSLTLSKYKIDVILPALLAVAGVACWTKVSSKGGVTAATIAALIGTMQLLLALHLFK